MPRFHSLTSSTGKKVLCIELHEDFYIHLTWIGIAIVTKHHFISFAFFDKIKFIHIDFRETLIKR